jgi:hypothetical protein
VARRPDLWVTAIAQALRLAPRGWWRRPPFLPLPARGYLHFRLVTAYGGEGDAADGTASDVVAYLEWCRAWPQVAGAAHRRP